MLIFFRIQISKSCSGAQPWGSIRIAELNTVKFDFLKVLIWYIYIIYKRKGLHINTFIIIHCKSICTDLFFQEKDKFIPYNWIAKTGSYSNLYAIKDEDLAAFSILEFKEIDTFEWITREKEFVLFLDITQTMGGEECMLSVEGSMETELYRPAQMYIDIWGNHPLAAQIPIIQDSYDIQNFRWTAVAQSYIVMDQYVVNHVHKHIHVYGSMVSNVSSSWNQAHQHCQSKSGQLFTLDSFEQWHILMDNMVYLFPRKHHQFWLSSLIFLGHPKVSRVGWF